MYCFSWAITKHKLGVFVCPCRSSRVVSCCIVLGVSRANVRREGILKGGCHIL